ncbi:MAG: hypothetical protein Q9169_007554 [Polycauliona sp. 2 TL-2023]
MLDYIQHYKITRLQVAPPIIALFDKRPEVWKFDLSSLRDITCAAAQLSATLQRDVENKLGVTIKQGWGMTECTSGGMFTPTNADDSMVMKMGSVGVLLPNMEGLVMDDDGREVGENEPGELWLRGPNILKGFQVAPAELEAILLENVHVADAVVVGIHVNGQEHPRAYIVLQPAALKNKIMPEDVQRWLETRVAKHKYLTGGIVFVDEVPRAPSGKILRKVVRERGRRDERFLEMGKGKNGGWKL